MTLDPALLDSVAIVESGGDPLAVSEKGAQGLFQFMPRTGIELAFKLKLEKYDPFDPVQSRMLAEAYLTELLGFGWELETALAAYNWGPENVHRSFMAHGCSDFSGLCGFLPTVTELYVAKVIQLYKLRSDATYA